MNLSELIILLRTATTYEEINIRRNEIATLLPVVSIMFDYDQNNSYHIYDLWEHSVRTVLEIPKDIKDDMLFLAALLHDIGKPASRCSGKKPEDTQSHFYGHPQVSKRIIEEQVLPCLALPEEDAGRLLYYVECHDDHVGYKPKHIRKHYEKMSLNVFKNLLLLQMADAITHNLEKEVIRERYEVCQNLYNGKVEELYLWLENEKK